MAVWRRSGKGRRERMQLMYVFARQVHLKPRFGFYETVHQVVAERLPIRFEDALRQALASAR